MIAFKTLFILILMAYSGSTAGQESSKKLRIFGSTTGYGHQVGKPRSIQVERYNPVYFTGDFFWQVSNRNVIWGYYVQPQFNVMLTRGAQEIEFGSNFGLRLFQYINHGRYLYQSLGSGPHYISLNHPKQAQGFIFSDNIAIGLLQTLKKDLAVTFQLQFRHISNAGLKKPNKGINDFNILIGFKKIKAY